MYIFISFHIVNQYHTKSDVFISPKISMITYRFFTTLNKKLIKRLGFRHHNACFCSISTTKYNSKHSHLITALRLWAMPVFSFWMNQLFKWFGSIAMTHLLTVTCWHLLAVLISHLKYVHCILYCKTFNCFFQYNFKRVFNSLICKKNNSAFITAC